MCGIIGIVSQEPFSSGLAIDMLKRLEYRGYDSFGIATDTGVLEKHTGEIRALEIKNNCTKAICHTRWATHGKVTRENSHPHTDCPGSIAIAHNGIIENYVLLKQKLEKKGCRFTSETDSEVIAHFLEQYPDMLEGIRNFFANAVGQFAVVAMKKGDDNMYAFKAGSPLSLGVAGGMNIVASDIYAFSDKTDEAVFFNENECAVISPGGSRFYIFNGRNLEQTEKTATKVPKPPETGKNGHEHYMIKEIHEEAETLKRLRFSVENCQTESIEKMRKMIASAKRVVFVASGSSYHACLLGVMFLNRAGIEAHAIIASEFRNFYLAGSDTLIIAVSQSGETMDVIEALRGMKGRGAKVASIVNTPFSTIQRMSNVSVNIEAGQEVCVAATKTFINQAACLAYVASFFGNSATEDLDFAVEIALSQESRIKTLARSLKNSRDIYIIGRGTLYPVAREIALKLKEISYIHAEGMMGGELKHGTLALIEENTPVIALMHESNSSIESNAREAEARGGKIIAITNRKTRFENEIILGAISERAFAIAAAVAGQLLTYHIAKEKGLPIDKPRNLAKCVTVK